MKDIEEVQNSFYKSNIIQPLKGFCATVEEGCSLTRASEKLFLTTSAIAKQIQSLEDKLHTKLFNRIDSNRVNRVALELTEDGKAFYEKAKEIIEKTDALVEDFLVEKDEIKNKTLKIGTNSAVFIKVLPFISEFKKKYNNIIVDIEIYTQNCGFEALKNGDLDIFISSIENDEIMNKNLKFTRLVNYVPYWVLYKEHPLTDKDEGNISKEDLIKSNWVFNYEDITMPSLKMMIDTYKIKTPIKVKDCGLEHEKLLIKSGLGIFLIFDIYLNKKDREEFILKNASNMFSCGSCGCFTYGYVSEIIKNFIDFLVFKKEEIFI